MAKTLKVTGLMRQLRRAINENPDRLTKDELIKLIKADFEIIEAQHGAIRGLISIGRGIVHECMLSTGSDSRFRELRSMAKLFDNALDELNDV